MKHITEEAWIEYHYGESAEAAEIERHLKECADCAAMAGELNRDLGELWVSDDVPMRDSEHGERVWNSLRDSLKPYPVRRRWFSLSWKWGLALAGAAAMLAVGAFYSGRVWEQRRVQPEMASSGVAANGAEARQSIILFVVNDHLDRSQRLLAELNDPDQAVRDARLQKTARELLTENRLYRQSAAHPGVLKSAQGTAVMEDPSLKMVLDDLEPVLVELANQPDALNRTEIVRLRKELNTGGLLFEIRVLRSKEQRGPEEQNVAEKGGNA
jgi:hypothetical protein